MVLDNNLAYGRHSKDLEPCNCGLFDNKGNPLPQNLIQASFKERGKKLDVIHKCWNCSHKWNDYKDNYASRCPKCNSQKMWTDKYEPEKLLNKLLNASNYITFDPSILPKIKTPYTYGHEHIFNNADRIAQASTNSNNTTTINTDKKKKRRNKIEELNMVIGLARGR